MILALLCGVTMSTQQGPPTGEMLVPKNKSTLMGAGLTSPGFVIVTEGEEFGCSMYCVDKDTWWDGENESSAKLIPSVMHTLVKVEITSGDSVAFNVTGQNDGRIDVTHTIKPFSVPAGAEYLLTDDKYAGWDNQTNDPNNPLHKLLDAPPIEFKQTVKVKKKA